jgi:hypothetical protein
MNGLRSLGVAAGGFATLSALAAFTAAAIGVRLSRQAMFGGRESQAQART